MALIPSIKWPRGKRPHIVVGCFLLVATAFSLYRPLYVAVYKWKEPYFAAPVHLEEETLPIRNDDWGEGHFGAKRKGGRSHNGIDIKADIGTVVYAAKSGRATCCDNPKGFGKYIKIIHPDGFTTTYGHLKDWLIEAEARVRQGQAIGLVGKSGNASAKSMQPHLHFEIRDGDKPVNPMKGYMK